MLYVLIVVSTVYYGSVVSMQEFQNEAACQKARVAVVSMTRWPQDTKALCLPKG